jgi:hypothetical protein
MSPEKAALKIPKLSISLLQGLCAEEKNPSPRILVPADDQRLNIMDLPNDD